MLKQTDWDRHYSKLTPIEPEPKPAHWGWKLVGMALAMLMMSWVGAWIAQGLS